MEELMIKIDNVSKQYKLGQIGGTTLRDELQRLNAKLRHKEDPTRRIGAKDYNKGEIFNALNGVSFDVRKGERVGIIGHNGAGKSTLLKLISRVTAPTGGEICLNGRVASMLEVGTGFHGELTGRENIYMNGAILGMTKKEIDSKIEDIIEFSECRQFIDTPVKRYSSGMYVKLAFSVAAHLDSEIMIMDEVLAVGDMAFQKKCLDKMNDVSRKDGRTILYVSHNMNTIRQLCDRVVVLDHGKVIFDGEVEKGIEAYMGAQETTKSHYDYPKSYHPREFSTENFVIESLDFLHQGKLWWMFSSKDVMRLRFWYSAKKKYEGVFFRFELHSTGTPIGTVLTAEGINVCEGEKQSITLEIPLDHLVTGHYQVDIIAYQFNQYGTERPIDGVYPGFVLDIANEIDSANPLAWLPQYWGCIKLCDAHIIS